MTNHPNRTASRDLICEWTTSIDIAIFENCGCSIRLYPDRAVYRGWQERWRGNTGGIVPISRRITGAQHAALIALAKERDEDEVDYTDQAFEIVNPSEYA